MSSDMTTVSGSTNPSHHSAICPTIGPSFQERLPAVSPDDLLVDLANYLPEPSWLRVLELPEPRTNIRCLSRSTILLKRLLDIAVASMLLVITAPVIAVSALIIKLSSPGPIFFNQTRVGLNARSTEQEIDEIEKFPNCRRRQPNHGRPFTIYKLRTMHTEASVSGPTQAIAGDNRVFPAGKLFRRMRIDELPQLVNVIRGDMSMVGPRPECIEYMEELSQKIPNYLQRLGLKPGLTGLAQIEAGYANDLESYRRKVAFDLIYLQNCCVRNDLSIILRTIRIVFSGFGAL